MKMERNETEVGENSKKAKGVKRTRKAGAKNTRYTEEQIEVLERIYATCPNPNRYQRPRILIDHPILSGTDNNQLKIWFQNRRGRDQRIRQSKELKEENMKLAKANRALKELNDNLMGTRNNTALEANPSPPSIRITDENKGIVSLAEETKAEFLSKVIGNIVNWIPIPKLKLPLQTPHSAIYVSYSCIGVAARVLTIVPVEPIKAIEILKNRLLWSRDCKNSEILANYSMDNGATIELIYTQHYAPTTMACARDFWTLRYTSVLDDGSIAVCEKSTSGCKDIPSSPVSLEFVRGRMQASGFLIRQCEGGSSIQLVVHLDLEASSAPQMVRPIYESSTLVAENMLAPALHHIAHVVDERSEVNNKRSPIYIGGSQKVRFYGRVLSRSFNDALNGFSGDGWTLMNVDATGDVVTSIRRTTNWVYEENHDGVICVKASFLLQNVLPSKLIRFLKEHRGTWMNFNVPDNYAACLRANCYPFPIFYTHHSSDDHLRLGQTDYKDEILEIVRFFRNRHHMLNVYSEDLHHFQISSGLEDTGAGACSELIFAPLTRSLPDDRTFLSSGFRILSLAPNTDEGNVDGVSRPHSMFVMAFQFPSSTHLEDDVSALAIQYARHVISAVKNISRELTPDPVVNLPSHALQINPNATYRMNSMEANQVTMGIRVGPGRETSPDSIYSLGSDETNTSEELEITQNSSYGVNRTDSLPLMGVETTPEPTNAMNSVAANPTIGLEITAQSTYAVNSSTTIPAMRFGTTLEPTYTMNSGATIPTIGLGTSPQPRTYAFHLANLMCQSYRSYLGVEMLGVNCQSSSSLLEQIEDHQYAILCFSVRPAPTCLYANRTTLNMLETTMENLLPLPVDSIIGGCNTAIIASISTITAQGFAMLPPGFILSAMNRCISYEQAVVWQVLGMDGSLHCLALAITNWSYI